MHLVYTVCAHMHAYTGMDSVMQYMRDVGSCGAMSVNMPDVVIALIGVYG